MKKTKSNKDWVGGRKAVFATLGTHSDKPREVNDYYATDPIAIDKLLNVEQFSTRIWEPACGEGHLSKRLNELLPDTWVYSTDLIDRGYEDGEVLDFLKSTEPWTGDIVTNPPYKIAQEFIEHSLQLIPKGSKVAMFLKLTFLEGQERGATLFKTAPPKRIWVASSRIMCAKNGNFKEMLEGGGSAAAYAWFIWVKGSKSKPVIGWMP